MSTCSVCVIVGAQGVARLCNRERLNHCTHMPTSLLQPSYNENLPCKASFTMKEEAIAFPLLFYKHQSITCLVSVPSQITNCSGTCQYVGLFTHFAITGTVSAIAPMHYVTRILERQSGTNRGGGVTSGIEARFCIYSKFCVYERKLFFSSYSGNFHFVFWHYSMCFQHHMRDKQDDMKHFGFYHSVASASRSLLQRSHKWQCILGGANS